MNEPWWDHPVLTFDLETTTADPESALIISAFAGLINPDGTVGLDSILVLIDPGIDIPEDSTAIHGITTEYAHEHGMFRRDGISFLIDGLKKYEGIYPFVAYNGAFDFTVLDREAQRMGLTPLNPYPVIDPFVLDKEYDKYRKGSRKLSTGCEHYGITLDNAHDASADAIATAGLARALAKKFSLDPDPELLHKRQINWRLDQSESLQQFFRRTDPKAEVNGSWPVYSFDGKLNV